MRPQRSASHRGALSLSVGMITAALLTSACTPPGLPTAQAPVSTAAVTGSSGSVTPASSGAPVTTRDAADPSLTVGIDGTVTGFNPYAIADTSPAATAVAALTLPSVSVVDAAGQRVLDENVVTAATVTSTSPFRITYEISRGASWSDGTPVTAEDFRYLREQMATQIGVRGAAPYAMITAIDSAAAGKQVTVTFSGPVADWQSMFSPLLPAHILKDVPGGFLGGLSDGVPVAAGPYRFSGFDRVTGEITLRRNDKFWAAQPGPNGVVLRLGTAAELIAALGRGDVQALLVQPGNAAAQQLAALVPQVDRAVVPLASTISLVMDTTSGATASVDVRRAIAAGLVPDVLQDAYTGSRDDGLIAAGSLVRLPSTDPAAAVRPAALFAGAAAAATLLAAAGWRQGSGTSVVRDGQPLTLTLGYPTGVPALARTARLIQAQLARIGIQVDLTADVDVIGRLSVVGGQRARHLDLALLDRPLGTSAAIDAVSDFSCPIASVGGSPVTPTGVPGSAPAISSAPDRTGSPTSAGSDTARSATAGSVTAQPSSGTSSIMTGDTAAPSTGTPSTGTPSTGTPSTGTPSTGTPSTGGSSTEGPSTGAPSTGGPSTGGPNTGVSSDGVPSAGNPTTAVSSSNTGEPGSGPTVSLRHGGNLSGWCDPAMTPQWASLLADGANSPSGAAVLDALSSTLLAQLPEIPLGQPSAIFAVSPQLRSVLAAGRAGWLFTGPLAGLPHWAVD